MVLSSISFTISDYNYYLTNMELQQRKNQLQKQSIIILKQKRHHKSILQKFTTATTTTNDNYNKKTMATMTTETEKVVTLEPSSSSTTTSFATKAIINTTMPIASIEERTVATTASVVTTSSKVKSSKKLELILPSSLKNENFVMSERNLRYLMLNNKNKNNNYENTNRRMINKNTNDRTNTIFNSNYYNNNNNCKLLSKVAINDEINECKKSTSRLKLLEKKALMIQKRLNHIRRLFIVIVYLILYIVSPLCLAAKQDAILNCTFPQRWEGSWFLSGYQQSIHIKGSQFSYRGKCIASDGNKYLIVDDRGCHRCLVIYEKHKNVLQYKESECEGDSMYMDQSNPAALPMRSILKSDHNNGGAHPNLNVHSRLSSSDQYIMRSNDDINDYFCKGRETLQNLCDLIPGDALLYSLFRENAEPVKCPLKGPFTFTYNRGHGECKNPISNIESCTEDSRLLLSFQACPDVQGTESTVEELTCLATWKDGNSRYLVGLVSHHHAISNEERFRCFVYEKVSTLISSVPVGLNNANQKDAEYKLAQSGDATCNGLDSAEVGSRIMTLRRAPSAERCDFPIWFKGPRHWHAIMGNTGYTFHSNDGSMHITRSNGIMETRALCEQINHQTSTEMQAVVHYTTGCRSGFMCVMFYRRDIHIAEIQIGTVATRLEDACDLDHFNTNTLPFVTLLASNSESQMCPLEGSYALRGAVGPPPIISRHKRNHNNKNHNQYNYHNHNSHHDSGGRRHISSEFWNSNNTKQQQTIWETTTHIRKFSKRRRRATASASLSLAANDDLLPTYEYLSVTTSLGSKLSSKQQGNSSSSAIVIQHDTNKIHQSTVIDSNSIENVNDTQRIRRDASDCVVNYKAERQLLVGCTELNLIDVKPQCNDNGDEAYLCHGSWSENGTVYVIAKHAGTQRSVCISYRLSENNAAKLIIGDACYRGLQKPPNHHLMANLTIIGKCGDTNSSNQIHKSILNFMYIKYGFILLIVFLINR